MSGVTSGATALYKIHRYFADRNTRKLEAARDELFRDWTVELKLAIDEAARLAEEHGIKIETLESRAAEPAYTRAAEILAIAAEQEPRAERRRMLAYAAASWPVLEMSVSQLSRTLRILLEIDPEDVQVLHTLASLGDQRIPADVYECSRDGAMRRERLRSHGESEAALLATGCVTTRYTTGLNNLGSEVHVSPIGRLVLLALRVYLLACENDASFASRPLAEILATLPENHPDRPRIQSYTEVADAAIELKKRDPGDADAT